MPASDRHIFSTATTALVAVNILTAISIACGFDSGTITMSSAPTDVVSAPWTTISYAFTHLYAAHLILNIVVLIIAGQQLERLCGAWKLIAIYIIGALTGSLLFMTMCVIAGVDDATLSGASASILALCAATATIRFRCNSVNKTNNWRHILTRPDILIILILCLAGIFGNNPGGTVAHIGGVAGGIICGIILTKKRKHDNNNPQENSLIDKATVSGYSSLSEAERHTIFKNSQRRTNGKDSEQ